MSIAMAIRKATRHDAQAVLDIRNAAIKGQCSSHYSPEQLRIWTEGELTEHFTDAVERKCYLAIVGTAAVATGMIDLESGKIDALFVEPNRMNAGFGKKMLQHLENLAIEAGLTELQLSSTLNAASFYRSQGFVGDSVVNYETSRGVSLACVPLVKLLRGGA